VLIFILHPIIFASIIKKITIGYSQSVGPFGNRFQEFMARYTVSKMNAIVVREKISENILNKWGITKNVYLSVDSGFMFKPEIDSKLKHKLGIPEDKKIVGVTVRSWLSDEMQEKYEKDIAFLCDYVSEKFDFFVVFIPQVTVENHNDDDRLSSRRVISYMNNKDKVIMLNDKFDHNVIKSIYGSLDYLIGTRFHSVIFALTSMVPSIAIQYEHKTRGIMRDLNLEKWVIDIDKTDKNELVKMFDDLYLSKAEYVNQLKSNLPSYVEKAKGTIEILKSIYYKIYENK
jgi:colanic acid/amylovoran biosynthesis protein